jgi:chromosome transmission fidelity protein 1
MDGKGEPARRMDVEMRDFHHPFTPYAIQETFMDTVYEVLDRGGGGVGILESPTGTVGLLSSI